MKENIRCVYRRITLLFYRYEVLKRYMIFNTESFSLISCNMYMKISENASHSSIRLTFCFSLIMEGEQELYSINLAFKLQFFSHPSYSLDVA